MEDDFLRGKEDEIRRTGKGHRCEQGQQNCTHLLDFLGFILFFFFFLECVPAKNDLFAAEIITGKCSRKVFRGHRKMSLCLPKDFKIFY